MPVNGTTYPSTGLECPVLLDFDPRNASSFPASVVPTWITVSVITGVVAFPIFVINLLVIWTVLERESLRSVIYNQLIAILSLTDLFTSLLCPLFVASNSCFLLGCLPVHVCNLRIAYGALMIVSAAWSNVTLMIISVERYLYIEHPLYYNDKVNTKKVMTGTAIVWLVVVSSLVLSRFTSDTSFSILYKIYVPVIFGGSVIIIFLCLTKVSRTTFRQRRAINALHASVQGANAQKIKEYKRVFALGLVVLTSVLFYFPLLIVKIIAAIKGNEWNTDFKFISGHIFVTFLHLQSLVNPIIFSIRLSYIRTGVLKKLLWRQRNDINFVPKTNPTNNREL